MKALALLAALLAQEVVRLHGGHPACFEREAWAEVAALSRSGDVRALNQRVEELVGGGVCYLTSEGQAAEMRPTDDVGTVRVRRAGQKEPDRWAWVSRAAVVTGS